MANFWKFKNTATPGVVELLLYGEIKSERPWYDFYNDCSGVYANEFIAELQALGDISQITCRINSPGGDIFAAMAIYTQLRLHTARVVSIVDGLAGSAATFPLLAADEIQISIGGMVMVHDPLTVLEGMYKAEELTKLAGTLDAIKDSVAAIYTERTKTSKDKIMDMMSAETWMTADEAIQSGFADKKISAQVETTMKGSMLFMNKIQHDLSKFKNVPDDLGHAQIITDAITAVNAGGSIVAQFVATAKKGAKGAAEDDSDNDDDQEGDDDNDGDGDGDGDGKNTKKAKVKVKNVDEEIDDDDAEDDAEDGDTKDKKAKKAVKNLVNKYPKLTNLIVKNAKAEERQRLQEIDAISNKISPALLNKAKYEDCTTAKDLAFEQMKASSANSAARASNYVAAFTADTQASGVKNIGSDPNGFVDVQPEQERVNIGTIIAGAANKILGR